MSEILACVKHVATLVVLFGPEKLLDWPSLEVRLRKNSYVGPRSG
jgi:hypothetical protein